MKSGFVLLAAAAVAFGSTAFAEDARWRVEASTGSGQAKLDVNSSLFGTINGSPLSLSYDENKISTFGVRGERRLGESTWLGLGIGLRLYERQKTTTLYGSTDQPDSLYFQTVGFDGWNGDVQLSVTKEREIARGVAVLLSGRCGIGVDSFRVLKHSGFSGGPPFFGWRAESSGMRSFSVCAGLAYRPVAVRYVRVLAAGFNAGARTDFSLVEFVIRI